MSPARKEAVICLVSSFALMGGEKKGSIEMDTPVSRGDDACGKFRVEGVAEARVEYDLMPGFGCAYAYLAICRGIVAHL